MSARLKRRSRAVVVLVAVASRLRPDPFYPIRLNPGLDEVLPQPRPWPPLFYRVATRELRQLRDCVIRPRCHRRVAREN